MNFIRRLHTKRKRGIFVNEYENVDRDIEGLIKEIKTKMDNYHSTVQKKLKESESRIQENISGYNERENELQKQIKDIVNQRQEIETQMNKLKNQKNVIECPDTHIFNPLSKRCVKKTSKVGMAISKGTPIPLTVRNKRLPFGQCSENKVFNPKTNRCVTKNGKIGKKLLKEMGKDPNYLGIDDGKIMFKYKYKYDPESGKEFKKLEDKLKLANQKLGKLTDQKEDVQELNQEHKELLVKIKQSNNIVKNNGVFPPVVKKKKFKKKINTNVVK